ncbi:hypothetical protein [Bifidobacterium sp. SO1]|uniref:hypothetical protein n=1 Tax=Bifidobacterium sp. SO1 TaxID=2809029 RepID=UPI001BDD1E14|nr:hypothetical protein [Bifidobacterium sp. SO1]MBT1161656.1 hypothetical protein [Bifidobacterium sp. SO1]
MDRSFPNGFRVSIAVVSLLLGVLSSFLAWAVYWGVLDWRGSQWGMSDARAQLVLTASADAGHDEGKSLEATRDLAEYLSGHGISLVEGSVGDGWPAIVFQSSGSSIGWADALPRGYRDVDSRAACVIESSFSAGQWREHGDVPLLPAGFSIGGVVRVPGVNAGGNLQYVLPLGAVPLFPGSVYVNTSDPQRLREISDLFARCGMDVTQPQAQSLWSSLAGDSFVGITLLFLVLALVCACVCVMTMETARRADLHVRRLFGATGRQVWAGRVRAAIVPVVTGVLAGTALSAVLITVVSGRTGIGPAVAFVAAFAVGTILTVCATALAEWLGIRSNDEVER